MPVYVVSFQSTVFQEVVLADSAASLDEALRKNPQIIDDWAGNPGWRWNKQKMGMLPRSRRDVRVLVGPDVFMDFEEYRANVEAGRMKCVTGDPEAPSPEPPADRNQLDMFPGEVPAPGSAPTPEEK